MKKIISAISALAVMAGLSASCQKELASDNNSASVNTGLTVTATIADNGTKVSYAEVDAEDGSYNLTPTWVVDDIIIGFDGDEKTYGYKVTAVNEGVATLAIITEGDFAGSATVDPANETEMYMIYAPGKKPSDISDKSLTVSLASQSKDTIPALMMAKATVANNSMSLSFENKTAIIGIKTPTMATESQNYTGMAVSGARINTEVQFEINPEGEFVAKYQTPGRIIKAVDFESDANNQTTETVYIAACPLTPAADLTFTANNGEFFTKTAKTMEAGEYYYMTPFFSAPPEALSGEFSVGEADKVHFSRGNLRCYPVGTPGAYTSGIWSFFDKQYECGPAAYNLGHDKEISLFTWGYDAEKSIIPDGSVFVEGHETDGEKFNSEEDWGSQIGDGTTWSTLNIDEWKYLFNTRTVNGGTGEGKSYQPATINLDATNVYGLILYPDGYTLQTGATSYTSTEWTTMEAAGCVFLPAAGARDGSDLVADICYYWSSTAEDDEHAYNMCFDSNAVDFDGGSTRGNGYSVRLVKYVAEPK